MIMAMLINKVVEDRKEEDPEQKPQPLPKETPQRRPDEYDASAWRKARGLED